MEQEASSLRLDVFLTQSLTDVSRSQVQRLIAQELVWVNGKVETGKFRLRLGDTVEWAELPVQTTAIEPRAMPLSILFEDDDLIVINKPAGLIVHPGAGTGSAPTLVSGLLFHAKEISSMQNSDEPVQRPGIVHRLDKDTTGALVVAKNERSHHLLAKQFAAKTNKRQYVALLDGHMKVERVTRESRLIRDPKDRTKFRSLEIDTPVSGKEEASEASKVQGRYAKSHFARLEVFADRLTLAKVELETGRTHQIRVHARDLKLPVVGDLVYHHRTEVLQKFDGKTRAMVAALERQMLHAEVLGFEHPTTGKYMEFSAPWPEDLAEVVAVLRSHRTV